MILQDGSVDPGDLGSTDADLRVFLRPGPGVAGQVASGSLTLQGKTFQTKAKVTGKSDFAGVQPGDLGPISLGLCYDVRNSQNIAAELNFYDAAGALLEQGHATIRKIISLNPCP